MWLAEHGAIDTEFINAHTQGFFEALWGARALAPTIAATADATGLDARDIERFYDWFAATPRVVTCYSQGVNQSAQGTDKVNAIINCHLATGRIGKPGSGPLSLTGQPNAMGGREVGGLANMLAAHMGFSAAERDRVRRFWDAPNLVAGEGLKAVDMFEAVADGRIKALWMMGTNPAVSLPRADAGARGAARAGAAGRVRQRRRPTTPWRRAHIALPAAAWGEKDGTVTNSERCISRQRAFLPPPGRRPARLVDAEPGGRRLGTATAFAYRSAAEIFDEHARLSGFENGGSRAFDISGRAGLTREAFDALAPLQWPCRAGEGRDRAPARRRPLLHAGRQGPLRGHRRAAPLAAVSQAWPFVLNTGRVRDQWHTMTRTGLSPRLAAISPSRSPRSIPTTPRGWGSCRARWRALRPDMARPTVRVLVNSGQQRGTLFVPIHWSAENSSCGRIGALVQPATDPYSGQPESKATPARIAPLAVSHYGLAALAPAARALGPRLLGARLARRSGMSCTSRSMRRAAGGCPGNARCCPRATPSPSPTPRPAPIARPCCATAGSRP